MTYNGATFWVTTYESNLPHALRFMIDNGIVGMSWIELKKGTYSMRPTEYKKSVCQIEIDVINY